MVRYLGLREYSKCRVSREIQKPLSIRTQSDAVAWLRLAFHITRWRSQELYVVREVGPWDIFCCISDCSAEVLVQHYLSGPKAWIKFRRVFVCHQEVATTMHVWNQVLE